MPRSSSPDSVKSKVLALNLNESVSFHEKSPASIAVTISQTKKLPEHSSKKYIIKTEGKHTHVTRVF